MYYIDRITLIFICQLETLESDIVDVEGKRKTLGRSTGYDIYPLSDALKSSNDNLSIQPRKLSLASVSSKIWSNSDLQFQNKNTPERNKGMRSV